MAPNIFSRLVPSNNEDLPWYEQVRDEQDGDAEHRLGLAIDEENLAHQFHDDELERAEGLYLGDSRVSSRSPVATTRNAPRGASRQGRQDAESRWLIPEDDGDNDVPASLLVEGPSTAASRNNPRRSGPRQSRHTAAPGPSRIQAQWEAAQAHQRLHPDEEYGLLPGQHQTGVPPRRRPGLGGSPRDKAMFRWANVSNLDVFIRDVYDYYLGAGMWCILLERLLHLLLVTLKPLSPSQYEVYLHSIERSSS
jgi:autophagy-related protein 9